MSAYIVFRKILESRKKIFFFLLLLILTHFWKKATGHLFFTDYTDEKITNTPFLRVDKKVFLAARHPEENNYLLFLAPIALENTTQLC